MWMWMWFGSSFFYSKRSNSICVRASERASALCKMLSTLWWLFFLVVVWNKKVRETKCPLFLFEDAFFLYIFSS